MIDLRRTSSEDPDFCSLVELLDQDLWRRYSDTQHKFNAFNKVKLDAKIIVAYFDGTPVGCGCFKETEDNHVVEMKRMYVKDEARGRGIAKSILIDLENWALEENKENAILETMINQPEAISLYKKLGYKEIEKYEPYINSQDSICMGKDLNQTASRRG